MSAFENQSEPISMRDVYARNEDHDDDGAYHEEEQDAAGNGGGPQQQQQGDDSNFASSVNQQQSTVFGEDGGSPGSPGTNREVPFPFDLVFVFDVHAHGARDYADGFYRDLTHDGLFACHHQKKYKNGVERIFVGVGASDRILLQVVESFHFTEEKTEVRKANGIARIFAQNTRQRILLRYLKLRSYGGPHATIEWMQESKILTDYFCLHDPKEVKDLRTGFTKYIFYPNASFVSDVEEYFGEEMAMYFAWLRTLIIFAIPIAIIGCVFFAFEVYDDFASWAMVAAGYFSPIYMQVFHEFWKRREKQLSFEFGTLDLEESAEVREGFRGTQRVVKWRKEKRVRHEGEDHDTIIVAAGDFELPIQHTVPDRRYQQNAANVGQDPFETEVVEQLDFSLLPNNVMEKHYPSKRRWIVYGISIPTSLVFCCAVVVAIYGIQFLRELLASDSPDGEISTEMSIAISVLNGVVIVFLNTLYPIVTRKLVEWENHRTQEEFEQSYITKLFMFVFVNSYFPLYLAAFRLFVVNSDATERQNDTETVQNLVIQIFTACISTVFVSNVQDIIVPFFIGPLMNWLSVCMAAKKEKKKDTEPQNDPFEHSIRHQDNEPDSGSDDEEDLLSTEGNFITRRFYRMEEHRKVFEHQVQLAPPQPVSARFMGRIILFGFATIFATIFPLGFVFVLLDAIIVLRVEIVRYLYLMRRAPARQVESIGGWRPAIQFILIAAAVTNCALVCFSTRSLEQWFTANDSQTARLTIFIATEHIVVFLVFGVEFLIPDEPMSILRIKALQKYLVRKSKNLLTYDAIDPRMPAHYAIAGNFDDTLNNYDCVQCGVRIQEQDWVRKFPCHHHIHDSCLDEFCKEHNKLQSPTTANPDEDINDDLLREGEADCPVCSYRIDFRYFNDNLQFKNYAPIRYRMVDYLSQRAGRNAGNVIKQKTREESAKLRTHARVYGLGRGSFPNPGAPPTGQPPKALDGSVMVTDADAPQSPAQPSTDPASTAQSPTTTTAPAAAGSSAAPGAFPAQEV